MLYLPLPQHRAALRLARLLNFGASESRCASCRGQVAGPSGPPASVQACSVLDYELEMVRSFQIKIYEMIPTCSHCACFTAGCCLRGHGLLLLKNAHRTWSDVLGLAASAGLPGRPRERAGRARGRQQRARAHVRAGAAERLERAGPAALGDGAPGALCQQELCAPRRFPFWFASSHDFTGPWETLFHALLSSRCCPCLSFSDCATTPCILLVSQE